MAIKKDNMGSNNMDPALVKEVYNNNYSDLVDLAYKITGNKQEAHDIVMLILEKLFYKGGQLASIKNIKAYLFISVQRASRGYLKKKNRLGDHHGLIGLHSIHSQESGVANKVEIRDIARYISKEGYKHLEPNCAAVMELFLNGFTNKEIAEKLGIEINQVSTQKSKGIKKLAQLVQTKGSGFEVLFILFTFIIH